jgi:hypothetical protein
MPGDAASLKIAQLEADARQNIANQQNTADMIRARADAAYNNARTAMYGPEAAARMREQEANAAHLAAQTNEVGPNAAAARQYQGALGNQANAMTRHMDTMTPWDILHSQAQSNDLNSHAYATRTQAYYDPLRGEYANRPENGQTPTDPRSIAYGGMSGRAGGGVGGGMTAPGGTYAPQPYSPLSAPRPDASGVYTDSVGRRYASDGSAAPPLAPPAPSAPSAPAPSPALAPRQRPKPRILQGDFGDTDTALQPPGPTSLNSTMGLVSNFSAPFAARGMNASPMSGMNGRFRAGSGIYSAPSSSFTGMVGSDPARGLADQTNPVTGQRDYGSLGVNKEPGWATIGGY